MIPANTAGEAQRNHMAECNRVANMTSQTKEGASNEH